MWELGRGFGHLAPYLDFVKGLRAAGHDVVFAARDVANADRVFAASGVPILQAPVALRNPTQTYRVQYVFAQLAHNAGLGDVTDLFGRLKAWLHIFNYVRPHLAIFDHSPTALLAARAYACKRVVSGSGFLVPPPGEPQPLMRYWQQVSNEEMLKVERTLLAGMNQALAALKRPPLARFCDLFEADLQFLLSPPELDHYPQRKDGNYLGQCPLDDYGAAPVWPAGNGRRIFAYLYPYRTLPALLQALAASGASVLVYGPEIPKDAQEKYAHPRVVFAPAALDMHRIGAECDAAVTNGTFGTTCAVLLAGKPVLMIPLNLERSMVARRVVALGAGLAIAPAHTEQLGARIEALLGNDAYGTAARAFAARHAGETIAGQTSRMLSQLETVLERSA